MLELTEKLMDMDEQQVAQLYKTVFDTVEAQLVLEDLRNRCFVKTTPFTGHDSEGNFNMGMQAVFLHIDGQIKLKPEEKESEQ